MGMTVPSFSFSSGIGVFILAIFKYDEQEKRLESKSIGDVAILEELSRTERRIREVRATMNLKRVFTFFEAKTHFKAITSHCRSQDYTLVSKWSHP